MNAKHTLLDPEAREKVLHRATLISDTLRCSFIDYRTDFAPVLADKLGTGFVFTPANPGGNVPDCQVIMVAIPPSTDPAFGRQMSALRTAAVSASGFP